MDELSLPYSGSNDKNIDVLTTKILEVSREYSENETWKKLSHKAKWIAEKYTSERWI